MSRSRPDTPLALAAQGRMRSQGMRARDLAGRLRMSESQFSRLLGGDTGLPRLGTFADLCRVLDTDPATLLEMAGLWPQPGPPASAEDHALLTALRRIEALPRPHKAWALSLVRALLAGAPSRAGAGELPHLCGDD